MFPAVPALATPACPSPRQARVVTWLLLGTPPALYLSLLFTSAAYVTADGYDGVGFVLAVDKLDLARFQPQPPGFPLLVLLARALHQLGLPAPLALAAVNATLLGLGLGALVLALHKKLGHGPLLLLLLVGAPLSSSLALSTLSDAAGVGALLLAGAALLHPEAPSKRGWPTVAGLLIGLALGLRPTLAPLVGLLLLFLGVLGSRPLFVRTLVVAAVATLLWAVPFVLWVGPKLWWQLTLGHAYGHVLDFGGSVAVDAQRSSRGWALLTHLMHGSFGHPALLLLLSAVALAALRVCPPRSWPPSTRQLLKVLLGLLLSYGLFVLLALPVRGHARHLLPLVIGLALLPVLPLAAALRSPLSLRHPRTAQLLQVCSLVVATVLAASGCRVAWQTRRSLAPGPALAQYVATHFPKGTRLYGARAARHLDVLWGSGTALPARYLGEVIVDLEHQDHLPTTVLVTSEVQAAVGSLPQLRALQTFCYDPAVPTYLQLDREPAHPLPSPQPHVTHGDGCVTLFAYRVLP